jgi:hypothetical protein
MPMVLAIRMIMPEEISVFAAAFMSRPYFI